MDESLVSFFLIRAIREIRGRFRIRMNQPWNSGLAPQHPNLTISLSSIMLVSVTRAGTNRFEKEKLFQKQIFHLCLSIPHSVIVTETRRIPPPRSFRPTLTKTFTREIISAALFVRKSCNILHQNTLQKFQYPLRHTHSNQG